MTFFANSGIAWPRFERETKKAGAESLEAASQLWNLFAVLEQGERQLVDREIIASTAESLEDAALVYASISSQLPAQPTGGLTSAERDLIGLQGQRLYIAPFINLVLGRQISVKTLYAVLATQTANLASTLKNFETNQAETILLETVFQMMRQWEVIAMLARVIAVLNRRGTEGTTPQPGPSLSPSDDRSTGSLSPVRTQKTKLRPKEPALVK